MKKEQVLAKLRSCGLVAVVRAKDADDAMRIAEACIEGGCAGIELTYTTPGVNAIIEKMAREYNGTDFVIGAGTVMDPETARMAILSGAQYVVSPYFNGDTVRLCNRYRVACMPGAMSIAEVVAGMEAGADIIKVFPGELFGPKILKSIHGPIPQAELMPTGGVSLDNVAEWIAAGAVAVGAGGSLTAGAKTGAQKTLVSSLSSTPPASLWRRFALPGASEARHEPDWNALRLLEPQLGRDCIHTPDGEAGLAGL